VTNLLVPSAFRLSHASVVTFSPNVFFSLNLLVKWHTMDQGLSTGAHQDIDGLRERNVRTDSTVGREALTAAGEMEAKDKDGKHLKTFGRTPDGTGKLYTKSVGLMFYN
jgi:hypothetical protein